MLKKYYKALNYIRKNQPITEKNLSKKFPDYKEWIYKLSDYYDKKDNPNLYHSEVEERLYQKAQELNLNVSETSYYVRRNMPDIPSSADNVFYSVNEKFLEVREKKKEKLLLFWLPYSITTAIAIASLVIQFLPYFTGQ